MVTLPYNHTPILVGAIAIFTTKEAPSFLQWIGIALGVTGTCLFFLPFGLPPAASICVLIAAVGVLSNSVASLKARQVNHDLISSLS